MKISNVCALIFVISIAVFAQDEKINKVNDLFAEWNKPESAGCAVGIVENGKIIYQNGYGSANLEHNIPITPQTVFHVASDSKQFTAFSILLLAQEGKLSLDDEIHKYLPELADFGSRITIRLLIYHVSGIRDQWQLLRLAGIRGDDVITNNHILKILSRQKELNFIPGENELYSNSGYTLLAEIVARVSGMSFSKFTEEKIFKPLKMNDTVFIDDNQRLIKNRADSYSFEKTKGFIKLPLNFANVGATNLKTTVEDLSKWIINFENPKVGNSSLIEQMYQSSNLNNGDKINYAFGLFISEYKGLKTVGHGGGDAGFRSYFVHFPDQKFAIITLCNLDSINVGASFNTSGLAYKIADIFLANDFKPRTENISTNFTAFVIDSKILNSYVGGYQLLSGEIVNFTNEYGTLMMWNPSDVKKNELLPKSQTEFVSKENNELVRFEKNSAELIFQAVIQKDNKSLTAKRLAPRNDQQLAEYEGKYYSEELDTNYEVAVDTNKLVAQHWRNEDISLIQEAEDLFSGGKWYFDKLLFFRDKNNKVTGFRVSSGRVKNLVFMKKK